MKFAGVCRAIRSLPMALRPSSSDENGSETEVVHLTDSALVFVPLECHGDVVAIIQIPRARINQNSGGG